MIRYDKILEKIDNHYEKQKGRSAAVVSSRAFLNVFYRNIHTLFVAINRSMFCSVIHKRSLYIGHFGH